MLGFSLAAKERQLSALKQNAPAPEKIPERNEAEPDVSTGNKPQQKKDSFGKPRGERETRDIRAKVAGTHPARLNNASSKRFCGGGFSGG